MAAGDEGHSAGTTSVRSHAYEKRNGRRFPLVLECEYRIFGQQHTISFGRAKTRNISKSGLLVSLSDPAVGGSLRGQWIELSLDWPVEPGSIDLILLGRIVRTEGSEVGVKIIRYGFARERPRSGEA
jgi:hypothetical protein